jgi:hypothetical protein
MTPSSWFLWLQFRERRNALLFGTATVDEQLAAPRVKRTGMRRSCRKFVKDASGRAIWHRQTSFDRGGMKRRLQDWDLRRPRYAFAIGWFVTYADKLIPKLRRCSSA